MKLSDKQARLMRYRLSDMLYTKEREVMKRFARGDLENIKVYAEQAVKKLLLKSVTVTVEPSTERLSGFRVFINTDVNRILELIENSCPHPHEDKIKAKRDQIKVMRDELEEALFRAQLGDKDALRVFDSMVSRIGRL